MLYFVAFLLLAGFVVLNMLVGVVVENFQKCRDLLEKDRLAEKERERAKRLQLGKTFTKLLKQFWSASSVSKLLKQFWSASSVFKGKK